MSPALRSTSSLALRCSSSCETHADTAIPAPNTSTRTMLNLRRKPIWNSPCAVAARSHPGSSLLTFHTTLRIQASQISPPPPMNPVTALDRTARAEPGRAAIFAGKRPWASYGELAVRAALADAAASDLAWLFYTSGTTGRPKGAMLSCRNLAQMTFSYLADVDHVERDGRLLHAAPLSHGSGLYNFTHLARGAAQVIPESGGFDPAEVLALLEAHRDVSFFAAPTMVKRLVGECRGEGRSGLRTIVYGGGPMYLADLREALDILGGRLAQIYGQGESPMTITTLSKGHHADRSHPRYLERLASVGLPHSVVDVRVCDPEGRALEPGEVGEICVRGDVVMSGYWRNPAATAAALRGGWLWTGDLGAFDADGFLTLKDRSKDLIVSGGSNIYPREVEEVLLAHPAVAEARVVGRPDREWGEGGVAFVVPRGAAPVPEELHRPRLNHLARFKRPKEYRFVERLPKNNNGKVVKAELRATLLLAAQ